MCRPCSMPEQLAMCRPCSLSSMQVRHQKQLTMSNPCSMPGAAGHVQAMQFGQHAGQASGAAGNVQAMQYARGSWPCEALSSILLTAICCVSMIRLDDAAAAGVLVCTAVSPPWGCGGKCWCWA